LISRDGLAGDCPFHAAKAARPIKQTAILNYCEGDPLPAPSIQEAMKRHQSGDLAGAEVVYREILAKEPENGPALHYLGLLCHQSRRSEEGLEMLRQSVNDNPDIPEFHCNLGVALRDLGGFEESLAHLSRAIHLRPLYPEALNNLGDLLRVVGKLHEAAEVLKHSIQVHDSAAARHNLALTFIADSKIPQAIAAARCGVKLKPTDMNLRKTLARAVALAGDRDAALKAWWETVEANPLDGEAWFGLGNIQRERGEMPEAAAAYERAVQFRPDDGDLLNNFGATMTDLGQPARAIDFGRQALKLRPDAEEIRYNLSLALLMNGELAEGWNCYESRWHCEGHKETLPPLRKPLWDGQDITGKTLLLRTEQGCGDAIQFARYIPLLARRGVKIILQCQAELVSLFSKLEGAQRVIARGEPIGEFNFHLPLVSLPRIFGTTLGTIPADIPYLPADAGKIAQWTSRLARISGFKCGLVWAGNPAHKNDRNRSLPPDVLQPLGEIAGVRFISLQKDFSGPLPAGAMDISADLPDFSDSAAAISQMDLVISADTSIAHLAGALGKPVWTMIPFGPDWRWMIGREDSPWYPTMRLFRQTQRGDWAGVVQRISKELKSLTNRAAAA
jgi:Flp pilus assembly protein TadD